MSVQRALSTVAVVGPFRCAIRIAPLLAASLLQIGCEPAELHPIEDEPFSCADEPWEAAKINPLRFIAHAGGEIDGRRYTNSREAIERAYENGLRLFELDLIETRDGRLVAAHDWKSWTEATGSVSVPPSLNEFKQSVLWDKYHPIDLEELAEWFARRPDAYLVTDKVTDFSKLVAGFPDVDRMLVEVFSVDDYSRAIKEGVRHPVLSLYAAVLSDGMDAVVAFLESQPVKFAAVPAKRVEPYRELLTRLQHNQACVYVFTSNDPGFLRKGFGRLFYGTYADGWSIDRGDCSGAHCDTY